ncbi:MAG: hypothetical protein M1819_001035 [Sarea resinae]|nr:MAG: hypothetical protein M1819_001035 [Sarea resinae]
MVSKKSWPQQHLAEAGLQPGQPSGNENTGSARNAGVREPSPLTLLHNAPGVCSLKGLYARLRDVDKGKIFVDEDYGQDPSDSESDRPHEASKVTRRVRTSPVGSEDPNIRPTTQRQGFQDVQDVDDGSLHVEHWLAIPEDMLKHNENLIIKIKTKPGSHGEFVCTLGFPKQAQGAERIVTAVNPSRSGTLMAHTGLGYEVQVSMGNSTTVSQNRRVSPSNSKSPTRTGYQPRISGEGSATGFLSLPPELRNRVYRLVLVDEDPVNFGSRRNFQRSSAFLRTCRQVHQEGRGILYGENSFDFEKESITRGHYFEEKWKEIWWEDVELFLFTIGPVNISLMREIAFFFSDASVHHAPDPDERRFINDPHLRHCLIMLGDHGHFHKVSLCFNPRKAISTLACPFLNALSRIQSDEVWIPKPPDYIPVRISQRIVDALKVTMTKGKQGKTSFSRRGKTEFWRTALDQMNEMEE